MSQLIDPSNKPALRRQTTLLNILLIDRSRSTDQEIHHLIWADTEHAGQEINLSDIDTLQPRAQQGIRTPRAIVARMNQRLDHAGKHWPASSANWRVYVSDPKLEICCGEAPFIADRYDKNGELVLVPERQGFLDRKLRVVSRFCTQPDEWRKWALTAYQSCYGYELSGSQLFLAREHLLYTYLDFWNYYFPAQAIDLKRKLSPEQSSILQRLATIISWNLFQMDGLTYYTPYSTHLAKIMDWQHQKIVTFSSLLEPSQQL